MPGYWNAPHKNAESFFGDSFLFLTGRRKDMIFSGGENIASSEVERVIHELPQIAERAVIGVPDARWRERPVTLVVLRDGGARLDRTRCVPIAGRAWPPSRCPNVSCCAARCRATRPARSSSGCCATSWPATREDARFPKKKNGASAPLSFLSDWWAA